MSNSIEGWQVEPLGQLSDIAIGGTPSRDVAKYWATDGQEGEPWVSIADMTRRVLFDTRERITLAGVANSNVKRVSAQTVLMSFKLSLGKVAFAGLDLYTNEAIAAFRPGQALDSRFLYYAMPDAVSRTVTDVAIKGATLNKASLAAIRLRHPALPIQQRIAAILISLDNAIEATEALIEKHQQIKAGLMHDLFTRGVLPGGQLRPVHAVAPDLYRATPIGWIPADWEVSGLSAKQRPGEKWIRTGPFGSSLKGEHWVTSGHPVITIGALGEGEFLVGELLYVGAKDAARLFEFQLKAGDVVFSRVADVGRSVVVREQSAGWIMSSNLMRIAVDRDQVRPDYLQMLLAGDSRVKSQIRAKVNSGGREVANSQVLAQLRFAWPGSEEQDRIVELGFVAMRRGEALESERFKLQLKKQGLMQDLLTGKVAVKVPEPAVPA